MTDVKNPFDDNAKFPFQRLKNAIAAYMDSPREYFVSMDIDVELEDLKKSCKRQSVLEQNLRHHPDFADATDWQAELDALKPQNEAAIKAINAEADKQAAVFLDDIKSHGYELGHGHCSHFYGGVASTTDRKLSTWTHIVSEKSPKSVFPNYKVNKRNLQFNTLPPAQRRVITMAMPVFINQLSDVLVNATGSRGHYNHSQPNYIRGLNMYVGGPLSSLEYTPNDFRKPRARNEANDDVNEAMEKLEELEIFKQLPEVRAVLIADIFWNGNKDAIPFLDMLDFMVDSGLVKLDLENTNHNHKNTLWSMYYDANPFATPDDKHECTTYMAFKVEGMHDAWVKKCSADTAVTACKNAANQVADRPDFEKEHAKRQTALVYQEAQRREAHHYHGLFIDNAASSTVQFQIAEMTANITRIIKDNDLSVDMDLDVQITAGDVKNSGEFSMKIAVKATEAELAIFYENGIDVDNHNNPALIDDFNEQKFIAVVNGQKKLPRNENNIPVGMTLGMVEFLGKRKIGELSIKFKKPKPTQN